LWIVAHFRMAFEVSAARLSLTSTLARAVLYDHEDAHSLAIHNVVMPAWSILIAR
jgi:hypothetical protein